MPVQCTTGCGKTAVLKVRFLSKLYTLRENSPSLTKIFSFQRPKTGDTLCKDCFFVTFETEIHETIVNAKLFKSGDKVAIAASGGKDSTVLASILKLLNERYNYGLDLFLLSIDEGITGFVVAL